MKRRFLHTISLLALPVLVCAQVGTVSGKVEDVESHQLLTGATVYLYGTVLGTSSDARGLFKLRNVPPGVYTVKASLVGYRAESVGGVEVQDGREVNLEIRLKSMPVEAEPVVVTANSREQSLQDVPVSVSTVTAKELADRVTVTLDDALRYVPGVNMTFDQVNIRGSTGYSRGVGSRVLVLFDGLPYVTGDTGEITWETLPMYQVERVEVVKGAGSALYGSSALGGVINVITKDIGEKEELRWRLYSALYDKSGYAEWDWWDRPRFNSGGFLSYSGKNGPLGLTASISRSVDESYKENDVYHRWSFFAKTKLDLSPTSSLNLMANYMFRTHGNFFWWRSLTEATRPAVAQLNGNVEWNRGSLSASFKEFISDHFIYTVKGMYYGNFWRDDSSGRINNVSASHLAHAEVQATYESSQDNFLTFGGTANYDRVNSSIFGSHPGVGAAAYVQDELKVEEVWKLTVGFRYDWQRVSVLSPGSQLSPKIGLVFSPGEEITLRGSFGAGFRYPSISELFTSVSTGVSSLMIVPNVDLKPERSLSYEVGALSTIGEHVFLELALFQSDFDQLIEASVDPSRLVIQFSNVTRARIRGAEIGTKSSWFDKTLSVDMSYTYIDPVDLTQNAVLKFRSRHLLHASGLISAEHFRSSVDFRYVSRMEAIDDELVRLGPIVDGDQRVPIYVTDARVSYETNFFGFPVRIGLNVNNVFNYHYVELIGNLSPVRQYMVVLEGAL